MIEVHGLCGALDAVVDKVEGGGGGPPLLAHQPLRLLPAPGGVADQQLGVATTRVADPDLFGRIR